jgi:hypothetical protein
MGSASETMTALPPNRRGVVAQWIVLVGAAVAVGVIVALIVTWPHHTGSSASTGGPSPAAKQAQKSQAQPAAPLKP